MVLTLANMCKYDETILLNKMAEEISLLQQAFAETGVQLDRIIDAYERKGPYVPTGFPTAIKFTNSNNDNKLFIRWNSSNNNDYNIIESSSESFTSKITSGGNANYYWINTEIDYTINFVIDHNFSLLEFSGNWFNQYEWVDPSTLPQS